MKMNWLMVLPLALTLGFFGVAGMQLMNNQGDLQQGVDTSSLPSAQQGRIAPNLDLEQLADLALLERSDLEGNGLVIVNFWASWCPPCRAEHPNLTELAEAGNPLFGVNYRDQDRQALEFLEELGNPYDVVGTDDAARNGRNWGVIALPETFFINNEGVVVHHFRGPLTRRAFETRVIPALAEAGYALIPLPTDN
jgi:cytochrome c biogenesis protein CcmG/thiol:disulfide interchange protein DsbE